MNKDLNKLTFKELKSELKRCADPERSRTIRILMSNIYRSYVNNKKASLSLSDEDLVNQILGEHPGDSGTYAPPDFGGVKKKFKKEIEKDYVNNGLMNRMNSELHMRKNKKKVRDFVSPFGGANGSTYAPFNDNSNVITDFSTHIK